MWYLLLNLYDEIFQGYILTVIIKEHLTVTSPHAVMGAFCCSTMRVNVSSWGLRNETYVNVHVTTVV